MVVPLPAGGTADLLCRFAAEKASGVLGQQVVIENRPGGAGGRVATEAVLRAAPDGYTLLCAPQLTYSITHLVFAKAAFDTRGMEPVSVLASYPLILIVKPDLPAKSLAELIAFARANPGKINYGHQGKGNTGHLLGELIMLEGKFRMTEIPYRGSAPAINDLLAGNIDLVPVSPTKRTSTPASSNCWPPAAASGSRITSGARTYRRPCPASTPIPGWRWRRLPARQRRSPKKYRTRSGRDSSKASCGRAS